jgi:hypothetical protein
MCAHGSPNGKNRAVTPVALSIAVFATVLEARRRRRRRLPARAVIVFPRSSTVVARDGAVRSVQTAELTIAQTDLEPLWNAASLENLARTYWRFLGRVTGGLIRVVYGENERSVTLLGRPLLTLLRFEAPEYVLERDHGNVRWRIRDGILVAGAGRGCGFLALDVIRVGDAAGMATLRIEVEVANFYPAISAGFSVPVYQATQSAIHVLVTRAFLRSLGGLDLAKSEVGRLAALGGAESDGQPTGRERASDAAAAQAGVPRSERQP